MQKYPLSIRIIHWLMATFIIALVVSGLTKDYWPKEYLSSFYYWHKSFGMLALFLIFLRVVIRLVERKNIPPAAEGIKKLDWRMAKLGHIALYVFMILLPVSGYLMSMAGMHGIKMFGYNIPNWFFDEKNQEISSISHSIHEYGGVALTVIISIHILAVAKHHLIDKVKILKRMV